ncbi:MAG: hypothetical protein WAO96_03245, partial [Limnochordia bacterium]
MTADIRDQLGELIDSYRQLTRHYQSIAEFGQEEVVLIDQGDMESLMDILRQKEEIMADVGKCQEQIGTLQDQIVSHYQLEYFSLNKLAAVID